MPGLLMTDEKSKVGEQVIDSPSSELDRGISKDWEEAEETSVRQRQVAC